MSNSEPNATPEVPINKQLADALLSEWSACSYANTHGVSEKCSFDECTFTSELHESATSTTLDQLPIDDQLIALVRVARALGYYDGAEWISRRAMAQAKEVAEVSEPCGHHYSWGQRCQQQRDAEVHHWKDGRGIVIPNSIGGLPRHPYERLYTASDPPAPEPSRTDAIAQDHPMWCRFKSFGNEHSFDEDGICKCGADVHQVIELLVAALADAERKLGVVQMHYRDLEAQNFDLTHGLADAEKRAKDAEDELAQQTFNRDRHYDRANALTRKLEIAKGALLYSLPFLELFVGPNHVQSASMDVLRVAPTVEREIRIAIAAIDAPAGEEAVSPSDWCLAVTCPSCGARCQRKSGHGFGVPHAGACAADCRNALPAQAPSSTPSTILSATHIAMPDSSFPVSGTGGAGAQGVPQRCKRCNWQDGMRPDNCEDEGEHDFEPVPESEWTLWQRQHIVGSRNEPANAQGNEAGRQKVCAYNGCGNIIPDSQDFCGRRDCGSIASRQSPPSAPRFTAKEARSTADKMAAAIHDESIGKGGGSDRDGQPTRNAAASGDAD